MGTLDTSFLPFLLIPQNTHLLCVKAPALTLSSPRQAPLQSATSHCASLPSPLVATPFSSSAAAMTVQILVISHLPRDNSHLMHPVIQDALSLTILCVLPRGIFP